MRRARIRQCFHVDPGIGPGAGMRVHGVLLEHAAEYGIEQHMLFRLHNTRDAGIVHSEFEPVQILLAAVVQVQ